MAGRLNAVDQLAARAAPGGACPAPCELADEVARLLTVVPLSDDDVLDVKRLLSVLPAILNELRTSGLPLTLNHGDIDDS